MQTVITHSTSSISKNRIFILKDKKQVDEISLSDDEKTYILKQLKENEKAVPLNRLGVWHFFLLPKKEKSNSALLEFYRKRGNDISAILREEKISDIEITKTGYFMR
jgi:hypothetical protein